MSRRELAQIIGISGQDDRPTESDADGDDDGVDRRTGTCRTQERPREPTVTLSGRYDVTDSLDYSVDRCVVASTADGFREDDGRDGDIDRSFPCTREDSPWSGVVPRQGDDCTAVEDEAMVG